VLIVDHYERLGVPFTASRDEIRSAYRRLARQNHPDARGDASSVRMAQINEAWRVLSDPARRAVYDAQSRDAAARRASNGSASYGSASNGSRQRSASSAPPRPAIIQPIAEPGRFPWRLMLGIAVVGIAFVLVNAALTSTGKEPAPDNLMEVGSCVDILDNGDAKEVLCSGAHDGVVADLRPVESICAFGTELHRDRQGMGDLCIRIQSG
jgi:hypothetical protein